MSQKQKETEANFITLAEAAKQTGYTPEYLNLLSRKEQLKAEKIGRNWYTKKEWVEEFLAAQKEQTKETAFLSLAEAAQLVGYTPEYLNSLARNGQLKAEKVGRNWHTKKEWLDEFLGSVGANGEMSGEVLASAEAEKEVPFLEEEKKLENLTIATLPVKNNSFSIHAKEGRGIKFFAAASAAVIILPLLFSVSFAMRKFFADDVSAMRREQVVAQAENFGSEIVNENVSLGKVAGEETVNADDTGILLASENFRVSDISLGGNLLVINGKEKDTFEISSIKSESFMDDKKKEAKLSISWQTSRMAISEIIYSKSNGQNSETAREESYGFNHSVVLSGLEQGASYVFQIKCADRWGNQKNSDFFGIYTSSEPVSVFDLIANALGDVFGWAMKK